MLSREHGDLKNVSARIGDNFISRPDSGEWKIKLRCLCLADSEINNRLIKIGDRIKEKHRNEFETIKKDYIDAVLNATPKQLQIMQKYSLQYIFYSDGWFLLHCIKALLKSGKLKEPTEEQRKSLTTLIING